MTHQMEIWKTTIDYATQNITHLFLFPIFKLFWDSEVSPLEFHTRFSLGQGLAVLQACLHVIST